MPARINHNAHLRQVHRNLDVHYSGASRQIEKLSSGRRVNRSSDDPASLSLADGIYSEMRALSEGGRNVQQSIQMLQVAEGALAEVSDMVRRMQELSSQAASTTYNANDRYAINREFQSLKAEIQRVAEFTTYNGIPLLSEEQEFAIQAGPSETSNDVSRIELGDMRASGDRLNMEALTIDTMLSAQQSMDHLQLAQEGVLSERNRIAAFQNRLVLSATTTASIVEKMGTSESEIRDADIARSMTELTQSQIMAQTAARFALDVDNDIEQILSLLR
jgi:flagellin